LKVTSVAKAQVEILRVGCIKNSQPYQPAGNLGGRGDYAVGDDGVAPQAILDGEGVKIKIV